MNRLTNQMLIGSLFAFGPALALAIAEPTEPTEPTGTASLSPALPSCPVKGGPVNLAVSVATDAGPVFFCCKACISKYKADPAKYAAKVTAQRRALADRPKIQVACPVSKEPADREIFVESNGKKVYFCCKGCATKYQRDPARYASALANSYTYQTKCPVMGEDIDPKAVATTVKGMNIYFCCMRCEKKFFNDPHKYTPNLVAQGLTVNPAGMVHEAEGPAGREAGSQGKGGHNPRP